MLSTVEVTLQPSLGGEAAGAGMKLISANSLYSYEDTCLLAGVPGESVAGEVSGGLYFYLRLSSKHQSRNNLLYEIALAKV